jgi:tetratricopeptide (TPR) repeat protein
MTVSRNGRADSGSDSTSPDGAEPASEAKTRALELFDESKVHFDQGEFEQAASLLEQAYETFPEPVLLYNLARAEQEAGNIDKAIAAYERYLAAAPGVSDRAGIQRRIARLREQLRGDQGASGTAMPSSPPAQEAKGPVPPPARSPSPNDGGHSRTIVPWVIAGAGLATLTGGVVLGLWANQSHENAEQEPDASTAYDEQRQAENLAAAANVAFVAGGVLAAVGIGWEIVVLTSRPSPTASKTRTKLRLAPQAVWLVGEF